MFNLFDPNLCLRKRDFNTLSNKRFHLSSVELL